MPDSSDDSISSSVAEEALCWRERAKKGLETDGMDAVGWFTEMEPRGGEAANSVYRAIHP